MKQAGRPSARRGRIALLSLLALGAFAGSGASPAGAAISIQNSGSWLESDAAAGENRGAGETIRFSFLVKHDIGKKVNRIRLDDDLDGTDEGGSAALITLSGSQVQQPTVAGGYEYTRVTYSREIPSINAGFSCPIIGTRTRRVQKTVRARAVLDDGQESSTVTAEMGFVDPDSNCLASQDYPQIFEWGANNFNNTIVPGTTLNMVYKGDDIDAAGSSDDEFGGIDGRLRNIRTGTTVDVAQVCHGEADNDLVNSNVTFPDRGRWVYEAELLNENCQHANDGYWFPVGSADVNAASPPNLVLTPSTTRPHTGQDLSLQASWSGDTSDGSAAEVVEWDLDGNGTYDTTATTNRATDVGVGLTSPLSKTVDASAMTPGVKTLKVKLTDNGAMAAADNSREFEEETTTFTVNSLPVLTTPGTVNTDTNAGATGIALSATDANSDTRTYSVTNAPDHGSGSFTSATGASTTYNYTPTSGYAGTDSITFQVSDGFGGTETETVTINVRPNTTITANPTNPSTSTGASFSFNSNGAPVTFQCELNDGGFSACTSPKAYSGLAQGANKFEVRAVATTGSVTDPSPAVYNWSVDSIAPDTNFGSTPPALSNSTTANFTFSSPDGTATFECRVDSPAGPWTSCTSPRNLTSLTQGSHTFEVRAKDPAGNVDVTPATHTWNVDSIAPTTSLDTFPAPDTNVNSASFSFTADESADFECELDNGGFGPCSSPQVYAGPLSDGPHVFKVRAKDPTGNTGNTVTHNWNVDTIEPETSIDTAPNALTNQAGSNFTFSSNESPGVTFQCRLDSTLPAAWVACTSPQLYNLAHGSHTFEVRATDAAGNTDSTPDVHTWTIDLINPNTAIDDDTAPGNTHPSHRTTDNNASFDFFSSDGTATFECRADGTPADFVPCTSPQLYSGLTDGVHTFHVRAKDPAGNYDPTPATWTWEIYNGLPDTIFDSTPPAASNSADATFSFHSTIPDSTFECSVDGGPLEDCSSPVNLTGLSEDEHVFTVVSTDEFGRTDPAPAVYEWTVDLTDPDTEITAQPADPTNQDFALFQFTSTEESSTFECKLDSGDWEECGETQPETYTDLDDGSHTFQVRAIDIAGNVDETPDSYIWTVDTEAPETTITDQPADPSNINNPDFEFNSSQTGSTFECRRDSSSPADWEPCDTGHQYSDLTQGSHTFEVRSTDPAGNTDQTPDSYTWFVDLTAPDTELTAWPADPTNETTAEFQFQGPDNHSAPGALSFECRLDSVEETDWQPCASPKQYTSGLGAGPHKLEVRATDEAGNTDASPDSFEWVIDLTAPDTTITAAPGDPTTSTDAAFEFTAEDGATFECRLDSTDDNDWESCASGVSHTVGEGPHVFEVRATDTAGNTGPVAMHSWVVDTIGPETTITVSPSDPSNDGSPSFEFTGDDTPGSGVAGFECNLDAAGWEPCASPHEVPGLDQGSHTLEVRAVDNATNRDGSPASHTWVVDTITPDTTITGNPVDPTNSTGATFDFTGDDGAGSGVDHFVCDLDGDVTDPCASGINYAGLGAGEHTFTVTAVDAAGNADGTPASYTWDIDLDEPETSFVNTPPDPSNDPAPQFTFESDEGGSTFQCKLDTGAFENCSTPHDLSGLADGSRTLQVQATDPSGNTDSSPASYTWLVDTEEPDSNITGVPVDPSNDTSPSFDFTGADGAGSGVSGYECNLDAGGWEPCSSTHTYSGVTQEGSRNFQVRAIDNAGNTETTPDSYTWTLDTTAPALDITGGPAHPTNIDSGTLTFTRGPDAVTVTCELDGNPAPGTCGSGSIPLSALSDGPHTFKVTVTDQAGNSASRERTWTVDTAEPDTTIDSTPASPTTADPIEFGFSADQTPATFECRMNGGAWTPCTSPASFASLPSGTHTFDVRATDEAGNTDPTHASHAFNVAGISVLGNQAPIIKRRIRALNVPLAGSFQVATISCRAGTCKIDQKSAKIKIAGKTYNGLITIEVETKNDRTSLAKGEIALAIAHFKPEVQRELVANHVGQLIVKLAASTDAGGASTTKRIKLKAKWLKELF